MLNNGPELSNIEIDKWGFKNIPGFLGCINKNEFPVIYKKMNPGNSVVINLDPDYKRGGTHWTALRIGMDAPVIYYKDSFGVGPPQIITDTIYNTKLRGNISRGLLYGDTKRQKLTETNCGFRAAIFLKNMDNAHKNGKEIEFYKSIA